MSEKRYGVHNCPNGLYYLRDVTDHSVYIHRNYGYLYSPYKEDIEVVSTLLNELADKVDEQQADLNYLAKFIGEFKVEEFKLKLRNLRMLEDKALKQQDLLNEQQSTIEAKNEYQRTLEAKIRRLKDRIKVLEKNE